MKVLATTARARRAEWWGAARNPTILIFLLLIPLAWAIVAFIGVTERDRTLEDAKLNSANLAQVFEENTQRIIQSLDRSILMLRLQYESSPNGFDLRSWAERTALVGDTAIQFALIGPDGFMIASTTDYSGPPLYLGDREHFKAVAELTRDDLYIAKPVLGRASGKWSVQLARRLRGPDGRFAGVMVGSLDPDRIGGLIRPTQLGKNGSIILRNLDGVILAARGLSVPGLGRQVMQPALRDALAEAPVGHYWGGGAVDGINRLVAYRKSDSLSLIVMVGFAETDIYSNSEKHRNIYVAIACAFTLLVLITVIFGVRRQINLDRSKQELGQMVVRFNAAIENMSHGLSMFDKDQRLIVCNKRYTDMYDLSVEHTGPGVTLRAIFEARAAAGSSPTDIEAHVSRCLEQVSRNEPCYLVTEASNGRIFAVNYQPMSGGGWVAIHQDITAQKRAEQQIMQLAHQDALTGLANRAVLQKRLEQALADLRSDGKSLALFMMDLDGFKEVNDSFGHPIGDKLLMAVAARISSCVTGTDAVARLGGDEFAVLTMTNRDPHEVARITASKLLETIAKPYDIDGRSLTIATSVGIVIAPEHGTDIDELMKSADLALYRAKSSGRNRSCIFELAMRSEANARRETEADLRGALVRDEFELHYHPIVDVKTGDMVALEALIRWHHPRRGLIGPGEFVSIAEETGLINPIGEWVLNRACLDALKLPPNIRVTVNVSPVQFRNGDIAHIVAKAIRNSGISPGRLELEITESVLLQDTNDNIAMLHSLHNCGVRISLDDFGTGYSSLSHLRMFQFDGIKIDRSFVKGLSSDVQSAAIVSAVAGMGLTLNADTVAEGIETVEQFALVRAAGCTYAQGFLFGRPCRLSDHVFKSVIDRDQTTQVA